MPGRRCRRTARDTSLRLYLQSGPADGDRSSRAPFAPAVRSPQPAMRVTVMPAPDLSPAHAQVWSQIQQVDPLLTSPYLTPAFVETVAAVRDDVFVGVVEDGNDGVGFFPFQRQRGEGVPVAHGVSDFHGLIASPGFVGRAEELTRGCGLTAWQFHHVPVGQKLFEPFHRTLAPCPIIELPKGLGANAGGPRTPRIIGQLTALARQLSRDHGPIRFEPAANDQAALHQLIAWKSARSRRQQHSRPLRRRMVGPAARAGASDPYAGVRRTAVGAVCGRRARRVAHGHALAANLALLVPRVCHSFQPLLPGPAAPHETGRMGSVRRDRENRPGQGTGTVQATCHERHDAGGRRTRRVTASRRSGCRRPGNIVNPAVTALGATWEQPAGGIDHLDVHEPALSQLRGLRVDADVVHEQPVVVSLVNEHARSRRPFLLILVSMIVDQPATVRREVPCVLRQELFRVARPLQPGKQKRTPALPVQIVAQNTNRPPGLSTRWMPSRMVIRFA